MSTKNAFETWIGPALAAGFVACLALSQHTAVGALVAYDGFETYGVGDLNGAGGAGSGWTGPWASASTAVVNASLSYSGGSVSVVGGSNAVRLPPLADNTSAVKRPFTQQTGTVYFSFLFRAATLDSNDFIHIMMNDDDVNTNSAGIGDVDTSGTTFGSRIGNANGGGSTNNSTSYAANTTYLLVGKVEDASGGADAGQYDRVTLWVNPTSRIESTPGTAWTAMDTDTGATFTHIDYFVARVFQLESDDVYLLDELRVGTDFASVVVPEPIGAALALAAPALLARRRRR